MVPELATFVLSCFKKEHVKENIQVDIHHPWMFIKFRVRIWEHWPIYLLWWTHFFRPEAYILLKLCLASIDRSRRFRKVSFNNTILRKGQGRWSLKNISNSKFYLHNLFLLSRMLPLSLSFWSSFPWRFSSSITSYQGAPSDNPLLPPLQMVLMVPLYALCIHDTCASLYHNS